MSIEKEATLYLDSILSSLNHIIELLTKEHSKFVNINTRLSGYGIGEEIHKSPNPSVPKSPGIINEIKERLEELKKLVRQIENQGNQLNKL